MIEKDPEKEVRNLAEHLNWSTAQVWEDLRENYDERRFCALGLGAEI